MALKQVLAIPRQSISKAKARLLQTKRMANKSKDKEENRKKAKVGIKEKVVKEKGVE